MSPKSLLFLFGFFAGVAATDGQNFIQTSAPTTSWNSMACSADGRVFIAAGGGVVYLSTNWGGTWAPTSAAPPWVYVSADGATLLTLNRSVLSVSTNAGATWATNSAPFGAMAISCDAIKLVATDGTYVYTSANQGVTWQGTSAPAASNLPYPDNQSWTSVASSADGTKLEAVLGVREGCIIYGSTDSGKSWSQQYVAGAEVGNPLIIASADGSRLYLTDQQFFYSVNSGTNWNVNYSTGFYENEAVACSADGSKLMLISAPLFQSSTSTDGGATWIPANLPYSGSSQYSLAVSEDGNTLAVADNGYIYIARTVAPLLSVKWTPRSPALALSWTVPSTKMVLQQSPNLTGTNWLAVTNVPVLNLSNLQIQVALQIPGGSRFYRLTPQ
jgi:hypothetical protein